MTRPYAEVIGDPIDHAKSPLIHQFWLDALGIDADYRRTRVAAEELANYFEERRSDPSWRGCNITVPHKIMALDHVADPGGVRDTIGAINTAFRTDTGDVAGTNTDAAGFYAPIASLDLEGKPVAVIGTGGAARAILFALSRMNTGPVTVLGRNPLKAAGLLASFGLKGDAQPIERLPAAALLVNATTLGMQNQPPLDIDLSPLPNDATVYDIVYAPLETPLLAAARARDLDTVDGLEMLVAQAAVAFEILFGKKPPRDRDDELRDLLVA
ncbi:shikimate dehydrogenase family protein [Sphingomonas aerophila]|jgi:shikimate dehydrogenase|uniref:Shikimate dehydrogenase (NADP(+)) n=1 Tax=Sphingomonas aerophila TaxID=1344948 RepID=A0A7W9BAB3_9SPHN|nr:shikimate dehydrogenase [Sphingomonas aerophila]MBB5713485.1 shikimate dehydrogenase [Sphingomonas aerophila]